MSVDDDIDEKIQEAVEQKVEERLDEERDRIKEEVREELLQEDAETSGEESDDGQNYSRRGFLKALGLGAGGLALSSAASADLLSLNRVAGDKTQNLGNILQNSNTASTGIDMNGNPITDSTGGPVDINADRLDGNQASNFATANDLSSHAGVTGAHHTKYTDENAQDAVGTILGSNLNYDDANNNISLSQGSGSGLDSDQVDGFDIQKNGNDTNGVINLDTNNNTITVDGTLIVSGSGIPDNWLSQFESGVPSGSTGNTSATTTTSPALTGTQSLGISSSGGGYSTYSTTNGVKPSVGEKFAFIFQVDGDSRRDRFSQGIGWGASSGDGGQTIQNGYGVSVAHNNSEGTGIFLGVGNANGDYNEVIDSDTTYTPAPASNDQTWRVEVDWSVEDTPKVTVVLVDNGGTTDTEGVIANLSGSPSDGTSSIYPSDGRLFYSVGYDNNNWYFDHSDAVSNV